MIHKLNMNKTIHCVFAAIAMLLASASTTAFAFVDEIDEASVCTSSCSASELAAEEQDKWYCMAKDSCGKTYIPECGNTCFSHAVSDAERLCAESSDDPDSCEVISPKGGSCSRDRKELEKKSKK